MRYIPAFLAVGLLALGLVPVSGTAASGREKPTYKGSTKVDFARIARRAHVTMADAEKAALASLGNDTANAKVTGKELTTEDDALVYEVVVAVNGKKHEIQVDAGNGKVLGEHERGSVHLGLGRLAKVSKAEAQRIALGAVEGDAASKSLGPDSELEVVNGYLVWEIDVKVKGKPGTFEVTVDPGNGKVLATEHEQGGED